MKTLFSALSLIVMLAGCVSIEKPSWQPGTTAPAAQANRETCPLPAQWVWNDTHKQWMCVAPVPVYYRPYYPPVYPVYGPIIHYPVFRGHYYR